MCIPSDTYQIGSLYDVMANARLYLALSLCAEVGASGILHRYSVHTTSEIAL